MIEGIYKKREKKISYVGVGLTDLKNFPHNFRCVTHTANSNLKEREGSKERERGRERDREKDNLRYFTDSHPLVSFMR